MSDRTSQSIGLIPGAQRDTVGAVLGSLWFMPTACFCNVFNNYNFL